MIISELTGGENHPEYQRLRVSDGRRHYAFLEASVQAAVGMKRDFLSQTLIKAFNYHAIVCLHITAGEYRPCPVTVGDYEPPQHYRVPALMDNFVNLVNRRWETTNPIELAAFVLWKLNHIHPFINGNGRTARAACYFVLCVSFGFWIPGKLILPELLARERAKYVEGLSYADSSEDTQPLQELITRLLWEQLENNQ